MSRVVAALAILLLIISVRTLVVGYDSYTPLVFAQLYIGLFALVMTVQVFMRLSRSPAGDHAILLLVSGAVAAYYFGLVAWDLGGSTYCGGDWLLSSFARVPSVYRCASAPLGAAGWLAGLWIAVWSVEWWSERIGPDSDGEVQTRRSMPETVGAVFAAGLLIFAVATLFVGTRSFRPILYAEMYVMLFALFLAVPTVLRAEGRTTGWFMLFAAAFFGALLAWNLAPHIDGPNYCAPLPPGWRVMRDNARDIARMSGITLPPIVRPTVFRCTPVPFTVLGGFAGWWIAFFAGGRRKTLAIS